MVLSASLFPTRLLITPTANYKHEAKGMSHVIINSQPPVNTRNTRGKRRGKPTWEAFKINNTVLRYLIILRQE